MIGALKAAIKRRWPALRLRSILFSTLLFAAALPGAGAVFLRVYENTLVRQTEAELVAQGAALVAAAQALWPGAAPSADPGPWRPEAWPGAELAWGLHPAFHGKGYAVEAASAAMDWIVDHLGWNEVIHSIDPDNLPSKAVAARLGSRLLRMGHLPEPYHEKTLELWGQSAADWKARRA